MRKIYAVEDDEDIRGIVLYSLNSAGFDAEGFETGDGLFDAMQKSLPSLVLLDIMLPGDSGLAILKILRDSPQTKTLPIIMLTAKSDEYDKIKGLDMGADDYITKPFSVSELISRVNAVLRRSGAATGQNELLEYKNIKLDNPRRSVYVDGNNVELTYKEYELLNYLMVNAELALDRDKIMEVVWGGDFAGESRTLDMHIRTLRQKLGPAGEHIKTVRSVGYKLGE